MTIRKYLFWKSSNEIRAYKITYENKFELMKPFGNEAFMSGEWTEFFRWFNKSASILEDEYIDFCFLSDETIELPKLAYKACEESFWNKTSIDTFLKNHMYDNVYEVFYSEDNSFIYQRGNIFDKKNIKNLFLKAIPEFSIDVKENMQIEESITTEENIDINYSIKIEENIQKNIRFKENINDDSEDVSLLNRYYREKLKKLTGN